MEPINKKQRVRSSKEWALNEQKRDKSVQGFHLSWNKKTIIKKYIIFWIDNVAPTVGFSKSEHKYKVM